MVKEGNCGRENQADFPRPQQKEEIRKSAPLVQRIPVIGYLAVVAVVAAMHPPALSRRAARRPPNCS